MRRIRFSNNSNGKLLADVFTTIRIYDADKFPDEAIFEIEYKNKILGVARLEAKKPFKLTDLNEITSLVDSGYGRFSYVKILKSFYGDSITDQTGMYMLVLRWQKRNIEETFQLFGEHWQKIADAEHQESTSQLTLNI